MAASAPSALLAIRSKAGLDFLRISSSSSQPLEQEESSSSSHRIECGEVNVSWSSDGSLLCVPLAESVRLYSSSDSASSARLPLQLKLSIARPSVALCCFSPLSSCLLTFERRAAGSRENLRVWSTSTGDCLLSVAAAREVQPDCWPLQWTADERLLLHSVSNELQLYDGRNPRSGCRLRVVIPHLALFSLSPSPPPYSLLAFTPVRGAEPAHLALYALPALPAEGADGAVAAVSSPSPVVSRSLYQAEELQCLWRSDGSACLCETRSLTDGSGRSYYGESRLQLLTVGPPALLSVDFAGNAGPVLDFAFHPSRPEFLTVQGFQPAVSTLFSFTSQAVEAVKQYGVSARNTVRFSPHGRFLCIAGFGNLPGDIDCFDSFKFRRLGQARDGDGVKSICWTPDSRHLVTAVLRPWRRVDNGFKLLSYAGELQLHRAYDELYQVAVQPVSEPTAVFPNRPASPGLKARREAAAVSALESAASSPASASPAAAAGPRGAYVPPHLRGRGEGADSSSGGGGSVNVVSAMIQADRKTAGHKKISGSSTAAPVARKRAEHSGSKQSAPAPARGSDAGDAAATAAVNGGVAVAAVISGDSAVDAPSAVPVESLSAEAAEKRVKACLKKRKQIAELKARRAAGQPLDAAQAMKVAVEAELESEIERLTARIQQLTRSR